MKVRDLTPLQKNNRRQNQLFNLIHNEQFAIGVMTDLPYKYPVEKVEKRIKRLIKYNTENLSLIRKRLKIIHAARLGRGGKVRDEEI